MKVTRYNSDKENQWNDFIRTSKNGFFMFDRGYMDYHSDRFDDHSLMIYDESDKLLAVLPANQRDKVLYSHQGLSFGGLIYGKKMRMPLMLEVMNALVRYAANEGFEKIIYKAIPYFYHQQPAQEDLYALFRARAECFRTDVSSTIDKSQQTYAFSSSRKSGLKKARETDMQISESDDFEAFTAMMNAVLEEKYDTKATHTSEELALLHSRFPENIRMFVTQEAGEMTAAIIIFETPTVAHTQYIASSERGKETGAPDLLLHHLITDRYKSKLYFDFGISTEDGARHLNESLIAQKEGAGARATVFCQYSISVKESKNG